MGGWVDEGERGKDGREQRLDEGGEERREDMR